MNDTKNENENEKTVKIMYFRRPRCKKERPDHMACNKCQNVFPYSNEHFPILHKYPDGNNLLRKVCKPCYSRYNVEYRKRRPKKIKAFYLSNQRSFAVRTSNLH